VKLQSYLAAVTDGATKPQLRDHSYEQSHGESTRSGRRDEQAQRGS